MCLFARAYLTLCSPMDFSPPGSSVCGIFQTRILEWVAISSSRGSSQSRDQTHLSCISYVGRRILLPLSHLGNHIYIYGLIWSNFLEKMMQQQFKMCQRRVLPRRKGNKKTEVEHFIEESKPYISNIYICIRYSQRQALV